MNIFQYYKLYEKKEVELYNGAQLMAFTKSLCTMLAYGKGINIDTNNLLILSKIAEPLVTNVGNNREFLKLVSFITKNKPPLNQTKQDTFFNILKEFRGTMFGRMDEKAKKIRSKLFDNSNMPMKVKSILENVFSIINSESPSGWKSLRRNVAILNDITLNNYFVPEQEHNSSDVIPTYLKLIYQITGIKKDHLSLDDYERLKILPLAIQEEWKAISKAEGELWRYSLINIVRSYGQPTIPVEILISKLKEEGIPTWRIPAGFNGSYDEKGNMFLKDGRQLSANQIGGDMVMYDDGRTKYVAKGQGVRVNSVVSYYTNDHATEATAHKSELIQQLMPTLPAVTERWRKDFMESTGKQKMLGAILETLYLSSGRMGSETGASGISVLRANHIALQGKNLLINYIGKKKVDITHIIKPTSNVAKELINYILMLKSKTKPNDIIWHIGNDTISGSEIRTYLKKVGFEGSPHKFRHLRATLMFNNFIAKNPPNKKMSQTEFENHIKAILTEIGNALGHVRTVDGVATPTWATAAKSYVDPYTLKEIFRTYNKRIPTWADAKEKEDE